LALNGTHNIREDDTPRLVYADCLTAHGDEADRDRAEFI